MSDKEQIKCSTCKSRLDSIFNNLSKDEISKLEEIKTCHTYKKGESIFNAGSYPRGLYCVNSGKLKITQSGSDGKEQIVHLIHDGNVMGHRAIFGDDAFSCNAIAMEDSHVCFIPKAPFYHMAENSSKLAMKIAHLLSAELKEAEERITHTAQRPVIDRIAHSLLTLKKNYGLEADQETINVKVKREELANLAGTTRETASRILFDLRDKKVIELVGKKIKILDFSMLKDLAKAIQ